MKTFMQIPKVNNFFFIIETRIILTGAIGRINQKLFYLTRK